ncbi:MULTISPECIES: exonuclease SbcCD subunit D [unclassified Sphingobacterium]|uniref:metallophosphoesterase family protein n=1 Tax=unclassified Sphingobacterium TaxID=2609468 RepID=UPI001048D28D|nr:MULTISPECIES: exonuclease SbcCD subunit D [unclassified Sphingobacterium]MCS3552974.1 exonuclease SbcD [Sphingobacterium sp. JUb21]TCR10272.1 exodeoxyribonuclease I subunit D [Sphingobacterium sp. JUb20]
MSLKILHTADWHLGKRLDYFSRFDEQKEVLDEIVQIADQEQVDLVIVAGDLFDAFNPPVEAIELLYKTLKRLTKNGSRPVIAIAGNHDSPDRVDAPDSLARDCGIIFAGKPNMKFNPYQIEGGFEITKGDIGFLEIKLPAHDFPIRLIITAFANEHRLKEYLGEDEQIGLNEVLSKKWSSLADLYCDDRGANILVSHLYMNKKGGPVLEEPDGEKPLRIGFADTVYTECIPPQIQYTALGHLHRYQEVGGHRAPVIYSSSPLCYSFSEAGQDKKVVIVTLEPQKEAVYKAINIQSGKKLIRKKFHSVTDAIDWLTVNQDCLVELTLVSETSLTQGEKKRIEDSHPGIIYIIPEVNSSATYQNEPISRRSKSINENFSDYFRFRNNDQSPSEELIALFNEVLGTQTEKEN